MKHKPIVVITVCGIIFGGSALIVAVASRHEKLGGSQSINRYVAVRRIESWTLFGRELYARSVLGVYDAAIREGPDFVVERSLGAWDELPTPIGEVSVQIRRDGIIESGDDHFRLGERTGYREEECLAYIVNVLAKSPNRKHRLFAASHLRLARRGDATGQTVKLLLADPDEEIRNLAVKEANRRKPK